MTLLLLSHCTPIVFAFAEQNPSSKGIIANKKTVATHVHRSLVVFPFLQDSEHGVFPSDGWAYHSSLGRSNERFLSTTQNFQKGNPLEQPYQIDYVALSPLQPSAENYIDTGNRALELFGSHTHTAEIGCGVSQNLPNKANAMHTGSNGWPTQVTLGESITRPTTYKLHKTPDAGGIGVESNKANLTLATQNSEEPAENALVAQSVTSANAYPFTEKFEWETFPPAGWTTFNADGDDAAWSQGWLNSTPGGQFSAIHIFGVGLQDGWLVSPKINLPAEGFFYLSFWSYVENANWYGKNSVWVSTGSVNPAHGHFVEVWTPQAVTEGWAQHFINLQALAGQSIHFAFRYEGDYAHSWAIDDISLGEEIDDSPVLRVNSRVVNKVVGIDRSDTKSFKIMNDGIQNLTFEIRIDHVEGDRWLKATPSIGTLPAKTSSSITLDFNALGLNYGTYQAYLHILSNDLHNPTDTVLVTMEVKEALPTNLTVIFNEYTFPTAISSNGMYVSGSQFGGKNSYMWTMFRGRSDFLGDALGISDNGKVVGSYDTEFTFEGNEVSVAGIWDWSKQQWEFLGMNPEVPNIFDSFYSSAYGITADGSVVVGMQWYPDWSVKAFKWTRDGGYQTLSPNFLGNTRANGISANGYVTYGWAEANWIRTPAIWHNDELILIDQTQYGEAYDASSSGNFVTGSLGSDGFIWSPTQGVTIFSNSISTGSLSPTSILNDGTVFGYTNEGFPALPPNRRAFVRYPDGTMESFNDYAESRGWFDASDWIFYSINDVTPNGNIFIGAAQLPSGESISFTIDFSPGSPSIRVSPLALSEYVEWGENSTKFVTISNAATGILGYNALVQYTSTESKAQQVPKGESNHLGNLNLGFQKSTGGNVPKTKPRGSQTLHYDGNNQNNIGSLNASTFYAAVRFPSNMISAFEGYTLHSVDMYIGEIPSGLKLTLWGAGTTTSPGEVILQQVFKPIGNNWNTIVLKTQIEVTGADLWVGFEVTHRANEYVMGIDGGPAASDGNWISTDGLTWERLMDYGIMANWNIRTNLTFNGMDWLSLNPAQGYAQAGSTSDMGVLINTEGLPSGTYSANIRVKSNDAENPLVIIPVKLQVGPAPMRTLTLLANPSDGGVVSGGGTHEAGTMVEIVAVPSSGYRFESWTNAELVEISRQPTFHFKMPATNTTLYANFKPATLSSGPMLGSVSIYPNPTSSTLRVESLQPLKQIRVLNMLGQPVHVSNPSGYDAHIDVSMLVDGAYMVSVQTTLGQTVKWVQIKR